MTPTELRECKLELLDAIHSLSEDPLGDASEARGLVDSLFRKLVTETVTDGEEEG